MFSGNNYKVAMMQPTFLSWPGYFELMKHADLFVFEDDFQFSRPASQRNKLFRGNGKIDWVSLPVSHQKGSKQTFREIQPVHDKKWIQKFLAVVRLNYSKSMSYVKVYPELEQWINTKFDNVASMYIDWVLRVCKYMELKVNTICSSEIGYDRSLCRSAKVISLLEQVHAELYLCANGSFAYMSEDDFSHAWPNPVFFQNHKPVSYVQVGSPHFIPYLSMLDAMFNLPQENLHIILDGTKQWLTWEERAEQQKTVYTVELDDENF